MTNIELLTFQVSDQDFALDIMSVREIRGWTSATPLPHAPAYMKGVINLRGTVLPIMDFSTRAGLAAGMTVDRKVIIVVENQSLLTGLLVDSVSDIATVSQDDLQHPPEATKTNRASIVRALTTIDDKMIRVLDLAATLDVRLNTDRSKVATKLSSETVLPLSDAFA